MEHRNKETFAKWGFGVIYAIWTIAAALAFCGFLTGCGHNMLTYSDGIMLETTINPQVGAFGVALRYGKILTVCVRENAEMEMQGAGSGDAGIGSGSEQSAATGAKSTGSVKFKVGKQITGYFVDALKAGASGYTLSEFLAGAAPAQAAASGTPAAPKVPEPEIPAAAPASEKSTAAEVKK